MSFIPFPPVSDSERPFLTNGIVENELSGNYSYDDILDEFFGDQTETLQKTQNPTAGGKLELSCGQSADTEGRLPMDACDDTGHFCQVQPWSDPVYAAHSGPLATCQQEFTRPPDGVSEIQYENPLEIEHWTSDEDLLKEVMEDDVTEHQNVTTQAQTLMIETQRVQVIQLEQHLSLHNTGPDWSPRQHSMDCDGTHAPTMGIEDQRWQDIMQTPLGQDSELPTASAMSTVPSLRTPERRCRKRKSESESELEAPLDPVADQNHSRIVERIHHDLSRCQQAGVIQPRGGNGKITVHEVVCVLLLARLPKPNEVNLTGIISFCNEDGVRTDQVSKHFTVLDTKTLGYVWQKLKGNSNATYETFGRAMRISRERGHGFFGYLETSKKRIYILGDAGYNQVKNMAEILKD